MARVFNFGAGPSALPEVVLARARDELLDWQGHGMSVLEMSHRGKDFIGIAARAEASLRELLGIGDAYKVLFLQGGAQLQFSAVPLNLLTKAGKADYVDTGAWSSKAIAEARRYGEINVVTSTRDDGYNRVPLQAEWSCDAGADYLHYTPNETIGGVEFHWLPESGGVPLVADMSSNILSKPFDVSRFGLIYAGAQKNMGIAGLTIVIVHESMLGQSRDSIPSMLDYAVQAKADSMANTAPTFAWYMAGLVLDWIRDCGGVAQIEARNVRKAAKLYDAIDASAMFENRVAADSRSRMNVVFTLPDADLDKAFLGLAEDAGLIGLKGHRMVGGMRASIYNAVPEAAVDSLVELMGEFERTRG